MAELSNQRYAEMLGYTDQLTDQLGSYNYEDLSSAGFSPEEVSEFEAGLTAQQARSVAPPLQSETFVRAHEPTWRERTEQRLAQLFGGENYDRGDLRLARKFTGTANPAPTTTFSDPTATFANSIGLADLFGLGAIYGAQEGAETMVQGVRSGDLGTVALGAVETGLNALGAVPGVAFVTKAGGKLVDDVLDASRRAEADKFFLGRQADAEGYGAEGAHQGRVFVPTVDELARMRANPTPAEQIYLARIEMSRRMKRMNADADDILAATGVLNLPVANRFGTPVGNREVFLGAGGDFGLLPGEQVLRDIPVDALDIRSVPQKDLGEGVRGDYDPNTKIIRYSEDLDLADAQTTMLHEIGHFDHDVGLMSKPSSLPEAGSDDVYEGQALRKKVKKLKAVLKDPAQKRRHDTARAILDDIRKSESAVVNYYNNPGEILSRAVSGENYGADLVSPRQRLNPYINPALGSNTERGIDALLMKLRPDLVDLPLLRNLQPRAVPVPMDVRRGQVNDPDYIFSRRP